MWGKLSSLGWRLRRRIKYTRWSRVRELKDWVWALTVITALVGVITWINQLAHEREKENASLEASISAARGRIYMIRMASEAADMAGQLCETVRLLFSPGPDQATRTADEKSRAALKEKTQQMVADVVSRDDLRNDIDVLVQVALLNAAADRLDKIDFSGTGEKGTADPFESAMIVQAEIADFEGISTIVKRPCLTAAKVDSAAMERHILNATQIDERNALNVYVGLANNLQSQLDDPGQALAVKASLARAYLATIQRILNKNVHQEIREAALRLFGY